VLKRPGNRRQRAPAGRGRAIDVRDLPRGAAEAISWPSESCSNAVGSAERSVLHCPQAARFGAGAVREDGRNVARKSGNRLDGPRAGRSRIKSTSVICGGLWKRFPGPRKVAAMRYEAPSNRSFAVPRLQGSGRAPFARMGVTWLPRSGNRLDGPRQGDVESIDVRDLRGIAEAIP
jgi:hypothetical protein